MLSGRIKYEFHPQPSVLPRPASSPRLPNLCRQHDSPRPEGLVICIKGGALGRREGQNLSPAQTGDGLTLLLLLSLPCALAPLAFDRLDDQRVQCRDRYHDGPVRHLAVLRSARRLRRRRACRGRGSLQQSTAGIPAPVPSRGYPSPKLLSVSCPILIPLNLTLFRRRHPAQDPSIYGSIGDGRPQHYDQTGTDDEILLRSPVHRYLDLAGDPSDDASGLDPVDEGNWLVERNQRNRGRTAAHQKTGKGVKRRGQFRLLS